MPMGANFGDIDNDGFLDIYLGTGSPSYASLLPQRAAAQRRAASRSSTSRRRRAPASCTRATASRSRISTTTATRTSSSEVGGATPGDAHALRLFENPGHGNDWLGVKLVGVKSNRAAIGARITVTVEDRRRRTRVVHRQVGSGGSFGASPLAAAHRPRRRACAVSTSRSGGRPATRASGLPTSTTNQVIEVVESGKSYTRLARPALSLRGTVAP